MALSFFLGLLSPEICICVIYQLYMCQISTITALGTDGDPCRKPYPVPASDNNLSQGTLRQGRRERGQWDDRKRTVGWQENVVTGKRTSLLLLVLKPGLGPMTGIWIQPCGARGLDPEVTHWVSLCSTDAAALFHATL